MRYYATTCLFVLREPDGHLLLGGLGDGMILVREEVMVALQRWADMVWTISATRLWHWAYLTVWMTGGLKRNRQDWAER